MSSSPLVSSVSLFVECLAQRQHLSDPDYRLEVTRWAFANDCEILLSDEGELVDVRLRLIDLRCLLDCFLAECGLAEWIPPRRLLLVDQRVALWAIAALERTGYSPENVVSALGNRAVESHWNYLRTRLPYEALEALLARLVEKFEIGDFNEHRPTTK